MITPESTDLTSKNIDSTSNDAKIDLSKPVAETGTDANGNSTKQWTLNPKPMAIKLQNFKRGKRIISQYQCSMCKRVFVAKDICLDHFYHVHLKKKRHTCNVCSLQFVNYSSLAVHQRNKHVSDMDLPEVKRRKRKKKIKKKTQNDDNEEVEENLKEPKIKSIEITKNSPKSYLSHQKKVKRKKRKEPAVHSVSIVNGARKYVCNICGKGFNWTSNYSAHKLKFHGIVFTNYHCQICNKGFRWENNYNNHMQRYHSNSPVTCGVCGDTFKTSIEEKLHRVYDVTAQKKCHVCDKKFNSECEMTDHSVRFSEELKCCKCHEKTFSNHFVLWKHRREVHKEELLLCCDKSFMRRKTYQHHIKMVHLETNIVMDKQKEVIR